MRLYIGNQMLVLYTMIWHGSQTQMIGHGSQIQMIWHGNVDRKSDASTIYDV